MSYILINGEKIPPPKRGVSPTISTIVDSGRNGNGVLVGQKIGRDLYKLDSLEWAALSADDWGRILRLLDNFVVNVTFPDPRTNKFITIKMYPGDRVAKPYYIQKDGSVKLYIDCKVNLIDTGE